MINGNYYQPTAFYFGKGREMEIGDEIKKYSKRVLLHFGEKSIFKNDLYSRLKNKLVEDGIVVCEHGGVKPNPRTDKVYEGIIKCRENKIDFVLAVGGGSVIDSAKAIAIGVPYDGDFYDIFERETNVNHLTCNIHRH